MSVVDLDADAPALLSALVTMPRRSHARETALQLATGGPIDAALIDCSEMESSSLSMADELIHQLVDVRGARWLQLIEPTDLWSDRVRAQMRRLGMEGVLSIVP